MSLTSVSSGQSVNVTLADESQGMRLSLSSGTLVVVTDTPNIGSPGTRTLGPLSQSYVVNGRAGGSTVALSCLVGQVQYEPTGASSGVGGGLTSIAAAPDKNTVDLSTNSSIAAIAATAAAKATLQTGALAPSATVAPNATAVADAIAARVASLVGQSPVTLDTLNELAAALGNDPNFATTMVTLIGSKLTRPTGGTAGQALVLQSDGSYAPASVGGSGGSTAPTRVVASSVIPLDDAVAGKAMPQTPGQQVIVNSPTTITVGPNLVDGGVCVVDYQLNAALNLTNCIVPGAQPAVGNNARVTYEYSAVEGKPFAYVTLGSSLAPPVVYAPGAPTLALGSGTANTQALTITAPTVDATHGVPFSYTVEGSVDSGATWTVAYTGAGLTPTISGVTVATLFRASATNATGTGPNSNTVSVAGSSLSLVDVGSIGDVDLTAFTAGLGWRSYQENTTFTPCANTAGFANIVGPAFVNAAQVNGGGGSGHVTYSDNANQWGPTNESGRDAAGGFGPDADGSQAGSAYWTIPAPTAPGTKVRFRIFNYWDPKYRLDAKLSDDSAPPVSVPIPQYQWKDYDIAYNAKTAGQSLRIGVSWPAGTNPGGAALQFIAIHAS